MHEHVSVILLSCLDQARAFSDLKALVAKCGGHFQQVHEGGTSGSHWYHAVFESGPPFRSSVLDVQADRRSVSVSVQPLQTGSLVSVSPTYSFMTPHDAVTFQETALALLKIIEHEAGFSFTSEVEDVRESRRTPHVLRLNIERADLITVKSEFIVNFYEYDRLFAWQFGSGTETFWGPRGLTGLNPAVRDPLPTSPSETRVVDTALHTHLVKVNDTFFDVTRDVREALYEVCSARILP